MGWRPRGSRAVARDPKAKLLHVGFLKLTKEPDTVAYVKSNTQEAKAAHLQCEVDLSYSSKTLPQKGEEVGGGADSHFLPGLAMHR